MQLFYSTAIEQETIILEPAESAHAIKVLRKQIGDTLNVIDGKGTLYSAKIIDDNKNRCVLHIFSKISDYATRPYKLHIAMAPTKSIDRYEWFLEKATEIGCDHFTPLECKHSERRVVKDERSEKIITSAVKQSLKANAPLFDSLTTFKNFVAQDFEGYKKFIAHCDPSSEKHLLRDMISKNDNVLILIGPEGDFSKEEVQEAKLKGFCEVSLGDSRLRTETAGVFSASLLNIINQ